MKANPKNIKADSSTPYHYKSEYQREVESFNKDVEHNTRNIEKADQKTNIEEKRSKHNAPEVEPVHTTKMAYHVL